MNYAATLKPAFDMYFNAPIEAFFTGKLFPAEYINDLQVWNNTIYDFRGPILYFVKHRKTRL
ncbi:MAG TPA: hypothetical protein PKD70_12875 [Saprospiraceae bacterium]|nr:hypothetical protein [Saprospiraceae bacterium]HMP14765.1 hypothetical protein [Saprospiraceae bacterium]